MDYINFLFWFDNSTLVLWIRIRKLVENLRDTFENWQSEFLQLIWQVAGLSYLWYIGSPQSKEEEERNQEMLQWIVKKLDPQKSEEFLKEMEEKYPKK
jgi:hypothetical protein